MVITWCSENETLICLAPRVDLQRLGCGVVEFVSICFVRTEMLCPTARNASAWTQKIKRTPTAQGLAQRRVSKGMATATTTTSEGLVYFG